MFKAVHSTSTVILILIELERLPVQEIYLDFHF